VDIPRSRTPFIARWLLPLALAGCGDPASGAGPGGVSGVYTSVDTDEIQIEFESDGTVVASMGGERGQPGTYTVDGEKVVVVFEGQSITFIRDGNCIEDAQHLFGRMCKGGRAGDAANVSTRAPPDTTGTWSATNPDGEFVLAFQPGNALRFTATPSDGSQPHSAEGKYVLEGDTLHATLADGTPMVLKWVNSTYESTAFGPPMKFTRK
jgi:hypothetical protein